MHGACYTHSEHSTVVGKVSALLILAGMKQSKIANCRYCYQCRLQFVVDHMGQMGDTSSLVSQHLRGSVGHVHIVLNGSCSVDKCSLV